MSTDQKIGGNCGCGEPIGHTGKCKYNFGYPSDKPCVVCGNFHNNQMEPRFNYVVCEKHQNVPPTEIKR